MTNRQWLLEQMSNMSDGELCDMLQKGIRMIVPADKIDLTRGQCICEWLKSEHKEQIKLSDAERVILENIDKDYGWVARDKNGYLNVYIGKPTKNKEAQVWIWHTDYRGIDVFPNLFQFIKWGDENPYNIEELLKGE